MFDRQWRSLSGGAIWHDAIDQQCAPENSVPHESLLDSWPEHRIQLNNNEVWIALSTRKTTLLLCFTFLTTISISCMRHRGHKQCGNT